MSWLLITITCLSVALMLITEIRNMQLRTALRRATLLNEVVSRTLEATTRELQGKPPMHTPRGVKILTMTEFAKSDFPFSPEPVEEPRK